MLTFEGTLKLVQKGRDFTDRVTGKVTPAKFTNYFQLENDSGESEVLELRSKEDFSAIIDREVVGTVLLYSMPQGGGFYVSLDTLSPASSS